MRGIDDPMALSLWEAGAALAPVDRAVRLLAAVAGIDADAAADQPIHARERILITACYAMAGPIAELHTPCPACGTAHDIPVDLTAMLAANDNAAPTVKLRGGRVALVPPTSRTVAAAAQAGDPALVAQQCVPHRVGALHPADVASIEAALEQAYPLLHITLTTTCTACSAEFTQRFDPAVLLWRSVEQAATRAVQDVDRLARLYGWSEADILALSPARRRLYLTQSAA